MKKLFYIALGLSLTACLVACDDDDDAVSEEGITIVSSDLLFDPNESVGTLTFTSSSSVSATTDASWATASVSGTVVTVSVEKNPNLTGRSASLTLKSSTDEVEVTIQQQGFYLDISTGTYTYFTVTDDAQTLSLPLETNLNLDTISFESDTSTWYTLDYDILTGTLSIDLEENTSGNPRYGRVYYEAGTYKDSLEILQWELDDILGSAEIWYGSSSTTYDTYCYDGILSEDSFYFATSNAFDYTIPLVWDETDRQFLMYCGQFVGYYLSSNYEMYTEMLLNYASLITMYTWDTSYYADLPFEYDPETHSSTFMIGCTMISGSYFTFYGMMIGCWYAGMSERYRTLAELYNCYIVRYEN